MTAAELMAMRRPGADGAHDDDGGAAATAARGRLAALFDAHFDFVWRSLRRLGVAADAVDDAAQQVWLILSRKLVEVPPGNERAFLFGTALRIASDVRRRVARRPEIAHTGAPVDAVDPRPGADEVIASEQARAVLDDLLAELPMELRAVFVLYEIEELTAAEIAKLLALPAGTVASRLRRARAAFEQAARRFRARHAKQDDGGRR